jgi:hypothetical protein
MKKTYTFILAILLSVPMLAQVEQKVIIEHFTNSRCGICASRNPAFYQTLENYSQVLHIAYHPSSPYASCVFSQHNPTENDLRAYNYGVYGGTPRVVIQGEVIPAQNPLISTEQIEAHLGMMSDYRVSTTNTQVSGNTYKLSFEIERVSGTGAEEMRVLAGLAEKEIQYNAPNGETVHHDVFRKILFYDTANINPAGTTRSWEFEYTMHPDWVTGEIFSYVIVQENTSLKVKQSASSLDSPTFIGDNAIEEVRNLFYPNPVSSSFSIQPAYANQIDKVEIFSMVGSKVKEFRTSTNLDISDLPDGLYFAKLTDHNKNQYSTRLVKSQ